MTQPMEPQPPNSLDTGVVQLHGREIRRIIRLRRGIIDRHGEWIGVWAELIGNDTQRLRMVNPRGTMHHHVYRHVCGRRECVLLGVSTRAAAAGAKTSGRHRMTIAMAMAWRVDVCHCVTVWCALTQSMHWCICGMVYMCTCGCICGRAGRYRECVLLSVSRRAAAACAKSSGLHRMTRDRVRHTCVCVCVCTFAM